MLKVSKVFHIIFWILISALSSFLFIIYSVYNHKSLIAIISGSLPFFSAIIQIYIAEKIVGKNKYYPTTIWGYLLLNVTTFLLFILLLFVINDFLFLKVGAFGIMTLIGIYSSYFILYEYKLKKINNN